MCGSNLLWYIPPSRHFTKTRYCRVKSLYTGHFTLKFRVKYAMCLKAKMWIPLPPRGGCVWQQIWTTHYRKNMEKYFRNFGKVSQSLNSRENDLYKNLILHLIFDCFLPYEFAKKLHNFWTVHRIEVIFLVKSLNFSCEIRFWT